VLSQTLQLTGILVVSSSFIKTSQSIFPLLLNTQQAISEGEGTARAGGNLSSTPSLLL